MRIGASGELRESAPCIDCANVMKKFKIKRVIYSNNQGELVSCKVNNYNTTHKTTGRRNLLTHSST